MITYTHQTAPTHFVEANGIRLASRRFRKSGGVPLVFNMHFTGTMDHWDPLVTDGLAATREVILFDNAGISSSSGEVPTTVEGMGANAAAFIKALGLKQVELLGQHVHFDATETSQAAGAAFLKRFRLRRENRDPEVNEKVAPAQSEALSKWGAPREKPYEYLKALLQPTLVINGDHDVIVYTINSYILQQNIPNAQLILYPDASHGALYQYPERFVRHVSMFLSE